MPIHSMECSPQITAAAGYLQKRLADAGKENLIEMVVKLYTFSRITADMATSDAGWLRPIIEAHDEVCGEPSPTALCDPNLHQLVQKVLRPKFLEKLSLHDRVLNAIWAALGSFNDDDAASEDEEGEGGDTTAEDLATDERLEQLLNQIDSEMGEESDIEDTDGLKDGGTDEGEVVVLSDEECNGNEGEVTGNEGEATGNEGEVTGDEGELSGKDTEGTLE
ncbi:MAG: hypothetical protein LQ337_004408 [Flavoplaca oasis]|nr:MAG: hypothetical protein LQ337_004408 [Flavoplaca oasis]